MWPFLEQPILEPTNPRRDYSKNRPILEFPNLEQPILEPTNPRCD